MCLIITLTLTIKYVQKSVMYSRKKVVNFTREGGNHYKVKYVHIWLVVEACSGYKKRGFTFGGGGMAVSIVVIFMAILMSIFVHTSHHKITVYCGTILKYVQNYQYYYSSVVLYCDYFPIMRHSLNVRTR